MKPSTTILLLLLVCFTYGQNSVYNNHFFAEGLEVTYQPTQDSLINYIDTGENLIWDYSKLPKKDDAYVRQVVSTDSTPYPKKFYPSNLAILGPHRDYVYLHVTPSKTDFIGFVPPDNSYSVHNYLPWAISIRPMQFGDTIVTPAKRKISLENREVYRIGKVETIAVATGTLKLPNRTYNNVLKIKEVQTFTNPENSIFYQATTYHWLNNEVNFPLMSCNEIIERDPKGNENKNRFAQYLVNEKNTNKNKDLMVIENEVKKKD